MAHPPKNSREDTIRHAPVGAGARRSDALDPEKKVFTRTPREIARSLKRSAERSSCPQSGSVRSAMSMPTFCINRAGKKLTAAKRRKLEPANDELRDLFGRE